jgi:outer membrane receptor protein involved in Fe transport
VSPTRLAARAEWRPSEKLRVGRAGQLFGEGEFFSAAQEEIGLINTPSLFLADMSVGYRVGPGELTAAVSNLLDERYSISRWRRATSRRRWRKGAG